jgi:hypothetical protein
VHGVCVANVTHTSTLLQVVVVPGKR